MNVEVGTEAVQFPEKEYLNGIFLAVQRISPKKRALNNQGEGQDVERKEAIRAGCLQDHKCLARKPPKLALTKPD
jgi:hypothetical protein